MPTHRKLAAILSADAAGYSRLMSDDEAATLRSLNDARSLFREQIQAHGGRLIDTAGDSVLSEFPSAVEAVDCASEIQHELGKRNAQLAEHRRMQFRIGINLGDVIEQEDGTIYGDGVNVAARLQALADPGSICISGTAYDQVEGKLPLQFKFIGEQPVKNIAKPVRAYRVQVDATFIKAAGPSTIKHRRVVIVGATAVIGLLLAVGVGLKVQQQQASPIRDSTLPMPAGPSIAVLPFSNLSKDPEQEYFADGLAEDILTRLSRFSDIKVIGRNSSFKYKGQAVDVRTVGRDLGVGFVLEGSVRRLPKTIRVTAQLLETKTGNHLWADAYDLPANAVTLLQLQDDITNRVVSMLADTTGVISRRQYADASAKPTSSLTTYDCILRARAYLAALTAETHLAARTCLEKAVQQEPNHPDLWAWLGVIYPDEGWAQYNPRPGEYDPLEKGLRAAQRAVELAPSSQLAHFSLAGAHFFRREIDKFRAEADIVVQLNPNDATFVSGIGGFFVYSGADEEKGIQLVKRAENLNPFNPEYYQFAYFHYYYRRGNYKDALAAIQKIYIPDYYWYPLCLAAVYAQLGRIPEAKTAAARLIELYPGFTLQSARKEMLAFSFPELAIKQLAEGLRKAGVPEATGTESGKAS